MVKKVQDDMKSYPWLRTYPEKINWDASLNIQPLFKIFDDTVVKFPNNIAIHFMGRDYTYKELGKIVNRVARGLQDMGVKKNTRVGIFMPNCPAFVIFYYAIAKTGGTIVNYNPLYVHYEIASKIDDSDTEFMVTLDLKAVYDKILPMIGTTCLKKIIICPLGMQLPFPKSILFGFVKRKEIANIIWDDHHINFSKLVQNNGHVHPIDIDLYDDAAVIQYTGGTTGVAKGAVLSHANLSANIEQINLWYPRDIDVIQTLLAAVPFFHVFSMTIVMNIAIRLGGKIVIIFPRFNVEESLRLIEKHKVTVFPGVPAIFTMINNFPDVQKYSLKSLKFCISGGAPLPLSVKHQFEAYAGCRLVEAYGLSETSPAVASNPILGVNKNGSIGIPLSCTIVKIMSMDDPEKEMPLGEKGEICIQGPQVMRGYWNRPTDTKKFLTNGLFHTGDIGYMDDEGYIFLVDRAKDLIICSGYKVYPRNVETAIYLHPSVDEVTVIGVPDEKRGETVKAFVKVKKNMQLTEDELKLFLEDKLSKIEQPKYIEFRDTLPHTLIGKLSKKELVMDELEKRQAKKNK